MKEQVCSPAVEELIGLAVAAVLSDEDSFSYHYARAKRLKIADEDVYEALVCGLAEKGLPGPEMREAVHHFMTEVAGAPDAPPQGCC